MAIIGEPYRLVATILCLLILRFSWSLHIKFKLWTLLPTLNFQGLKSKFDRFIYLFRGVDMIHEGYLKSNGKPYVVNTPSRKHLMVTSRHDIQEVIAAPNHVLSLHAVAKDFLQPKYTMHGFVWNDQRGVEGVGFVRALRTMLTNNLADLVDSLHLCVKDQFEAELREYPVKNGYSGLFQACRFCFEAYVSVSHVNDYLGYHQTRIFSVAERVVARCNARVFFPSELSSNPVFLEAALKFPRDCFVAAEILRILPNAVAPLIAWSVTRRYRASSIMYDYLIKVVRQRLNQDPSCVSEKANDGVQWLIDTSPKRENWTVERLVGEIMAIWYGSLHTLSIATTYALLDLYSHPEIVEPLRNEVQGASISQFVEHSRGLLLLDSFLKESARLSAFESTAIRREVLQPFTLSSGPTVLPGDWICVPHRSMMRDDSLYPDVLKFDAFRFVEGRDTSRLTTSSDSWLVWGAGRILCPGRFYAATILKLVVAHLVTEYDAILPVSETSRSMQWRSALIPKSNNVLLLRRKIENSS